MHPSTISASTPLSPAKPGRSLRLGVAGGPRAPQRVRAWLATATWVPEELRRSLVLLTCELVNNSVLHGGASERDVIEVEVSVTAAGVRAQVSDPGPGFAPPGRRRPMDEPGGWGLVLLERMAERWGVERHGRTCVWFELVAA